MSLLNAIKRDVKREGIQTRARHNTIIPAMVGARLLVHNGKEFMPLNIREEMVGQKLADFVRCTKPFTYRATNANKKTSK